MKTESKSMSVLGPKWLQLEKAPLIKMNSFKVQNFNVITTGLKASGVVKLTLDVQFILTWEVQNLFQQAD